MNAAPIFRFAPPVRPAPVLRRCACAGKGECVECRKKRPGLRRSASAATAPGLAPPLVHDVLRTSGKPLDEATRAYMEPRFGHSFADVRIHADARAAESAAAVRANAYAVGRDVVFGAGKYAPGSAEGRRLIAHELAHVVQQEGAASAGPMASLMVGAVDTPEERQADAAADRVAAGQSATVAAAHGAAVRRDPETRGATPEAERVEEHTVAGGETLGGIAQKYGSTVQAIKDANALSSDTIHPGQKLKIPVKGKAAPPARPPAGTPAPACAITVRSNADTQILAGAIFAEASGSSKSDEREAIGWSFVNPVKHTLGLCAGTVCPDLPTHKRTFMCKIDKRDLGDTVIGAVKIGSVAFGSTRWNLVMSGTSMKSAAELCALVPGERAAVVAAIASAEAVAGGTAAARDYMRFNKAADTPPSDRMEKSARLGSHTFYRFKADRVCG